MFNVNKLIWDEFNIAHIARHDVVKEEVEQVCKGKHVIRETYGGRLMVIGYTQADRVLAIVIHPKTEGTFYVVTARTADRKERRTYELEIAEGGEKAA